MVLQLGERCTYPGSTQTFTVNADGSATFGPFTSGTSINITSANLTLVANRQSDGSWLLGRVGADSTPTPNPEPTPDDGVCREGLILRPGDSCTYPGTSTELTITTDNRARFGFVTAGTGISLINTTINGVRYTLVVTKQPDGTWLIERIGS